MTRSEALPTSPDRQATWPAWPFDGPEAVLIQVPLVQVRPDRRHPAPRRAAKFHCVRRPGGARRPRRRLKRGVRLAGRVLIALVLLALCWSQTGYGHHDHRSPLRLIAPRMPRLPSLGAGWNVGEQKPWAQARPAVVLSVEPAPSTADAHMDAAVVLPGYLLPDDGHEESIHEGS